MNNKTAYLKMTPDYPGDKTQEICGYISLEVLENFVVFTIQSDDIEYLYFNQKYILEMTTNQGLL